MFINDSEMIYIFSHFQAMERDPAKKKKNRVRDNIQSYFLYKLFFLEKNMFTIKFINKTKCVMVFVHD